MRTPVTRTIGSHSYTCTPCGAIEGRRLLLRLVNIVGSALQTGVTAKELPATLGAIVAKLGDDDLELFCASFGKLCTVKLGDKAPSVADVFDMHFAAEYGSMVEWLKFCLEVNYGSFFGEMLRKVKAPAALSAEKAP